MSGEALCLAAAALWAVSVQLYHPAIREFGARSVNLVKCALAAVLQALTVVILGQSSALGSAPRSAVVALALSGFIGLCLGDTALFAAVGRIGPQRTLLLQTLAPLFAALLAAATGGERPEPMDAVAALVILAGVAIVVAPQRDSARAPGEPAWPLAGLALGAAAAACQGAGVVLAKAGAIALPTAVASAVRLAVAASGLVVLAAATGGARRVAALARSPRALGRVVPAMLLGTYLALYAMIAGIARAPASIAAVLLATSPVFALVLESWSERRWMRPRALAGTLLAVAGVAWLVSG